MEEIHIFNTSLNIGNLGHYFKSKLTHYRYLTNRAVETTRVTSCRAVAQIVLASIIHTVYKDGNTT